jgi:hypothetical protein
VADQTPFDAYRATLRDVVASVIASQFIVDYGIITAVSSDKKKVDVKHAVIDTLKTGEALDAYETSSVELLYPSSSGLSIKYDVAVNDPVLLIGLKNLVDDTTAVNPATQTAYTHYNQATLKAIPLAGADTAAKVRMITDNGLLTVENNNGKFELKANGQVSLNNGNLTVDP